MTIRKAVFVGRLCGVILVAVNVTGPAAAEPEKYELDPAHTQVLFSIDRFGFSRIVGQFTDIKGTVRLNREKPAESSVEVVIGTASISSGNDDRETALKGGFWLDVAAHPQMRFKSTSVEMTGDRSAKVSGKLTIKNFTKPVTLDVTLNKLGQDPATQKEAAGFSASTRISRSEFGIDTAPELIGDEVLIQIEALAHRTGD